jgi:hypothetical protein
VTVRWPAGASPSRYDLQFSDDGSTWRTVRHVERARGDVQHHHFPDAQARRCACWAGTQPAAIELGEAADANAFFTAIARQSGRARTRAPTSASSRIGPSSASTADAWLRC